MAHFEGYKCDGCGTVKGEANHWLIGARISGSLAVTTNWGYAIGKWNSAIENSCQHFCGMECALKRLNEHLEAK